MVVWLGIRPSNGAVLNEFPREAEQFRTDLILYLQGETPMPSNRNRRVANSLLNDIKAMGSALLDSRKLAGAERLAGLAEAAQTLSGSLDDTPFLQHYANLAGESLEGLAHYIERTDVEDIFEDAVDLAKAQPVLTLTLTIIGGVAITQMLRGWRAERPMTSRSRRPTKRAAKSGTKKTAKRRKA